MAAKRTELDDHHNDRQDDRHEERDEKAGRPFPPIPGPLDHVGPFEVRGVVGARSQSSTEHTVTVGWRDGEIYGDEAAVVAVRMASRVYDGALVGPPTGPFTETAEEHLASPVSAYQLMKNVLSRVSVVEGEIPEPRAVGGRIP